MSCNVEVELFCSAYEHFHEVEGLVSGEDGMVGAVCVSDFGILHGLVLSLARFNYRV